MERTFRAEKMFARVKKENLEHFLDAEMVELIKKLDGKKGDDRNWESVLNDNPLVWIPADDDHNGTYVALCDCD